MEREIRCDTCGRVMSADEIERHDSRVIRPTDYTCDDCLEATGWDMHYENSRED